jgi:hypothetical protein
LAAAFIYGRHRSADIQESHGVFLVSSSAHLEARLTQPQTTEVIAKAAWLKAAAQLDRVLGQTLENSGISLKAN